MRVVEVKITDWDDSQYFVSELDNINPNDYVIVRTDTATEIGKVVGFKDIEEEINKDNVVIRKASKSDFEKIPNGKRREECLDYCREKISKHELPMKLVDIHFSLDGLRIIFAFIADGRVDFRGLLKDLTSHFNCNIRLNQIGIRDEAKMMGDCGHCGRELCCKKIINNFSSITSEMAELQQISHRGSDRISGICGRLMCCLSFEQETYEELIKNLPEVGKKVSVDGRKGRVVGQNIIKQSVDVCFPTENGGDDIIEEVDINRNKK